MITLLYWYVQNFIVIRQISKKLWANNFYKIPDEIEFCHWDYTGNWYHWKGVGHNMILISKTDSDLMIFTIWDLDILDMNILSCIELWLISLNKQPQSFKWGPWGFNYKSLTKIPSNTTLIRTLPYVIPHEMLVTPRWIVRNRYF